MTTSPKDPTQELENNVKNLLSVLRGHTHDWPSTETDWETLDKIVKELRSDLKLRRGLSFIQ